MRVAGLVCARLDGGLDGAELAYRADLFADEEGQRAPGRASRRGGRDDRREGEPGRRW